MPTNLRFDPDKVAYYEKGGWEAYYDRKWLTAFGLMVRLSHEQFSMPWPTAIAAAIDIVRASRAFAPLDNDVPAAQRFLEAFYSKAARHVHLSADAATLADLEMRYWIVHRQLAIRRQQDHADSEIEPMVEALARLHAALFGGTEDAMRASAGLRAQAAVAVDRITGKYSTDVAADWREVEQYLQRAYRAVQTA